MSGLANAVFSDSEAKLEKLGEPSSEVFLDTHPRSLIQGSPNFLSPHSLKEF